MTREKITTLDMQVPIEGFKVEGTAQMKLEPTAEKQLRMMFLANDIVGFEYDGGSNITVLLRTRDDIVLTATSEYNEE